MILQKILNESAKLWTYGESHPKSDAMKYIFKEIDSSVWKYCWAGSSWSDGWMDSDAAWQNDEAPSHHHPCVGTRCLPTHSKNISQQDPYF